MASLEMCILGSPLRGPWNLEEIIRDDRVLGAARCQALCLVIGAVVLGSAYLCPALSVAGASLASPCSVSTPWSNRTCPIKASGYSCHVAAPGRHTGSSLSRAEIAALGQSEH